MYKIAKEDQPEVEMFDGAVRRTLACGRDILLARFEYKKDSKVPPHKHAYEQVTTILEGSQRIIIRKNEKHTKTVFFKLEMPTLCRQTPNMNRSI